LFDTNLYNLPKTAPAGLNSNSSLQNNQVIASGERHKKMTSNALGIAAEILFAFCKKIAADSPARQGNAPIDKRII